MNSKNGKTSDSIDYYLIFQIKQTQKGLANMWLCQILAISIHGKR